MAFRTKNLYSAVKQDSSSLTSSAEIMLGDNIRNMDDDSDPIDVDINSSNNMTQIEMYQTFIGQSPKYGNEDQLMLNKSNKKYNKFKKKRNFGRSQRKQKKDDIFAFIKDCFGKNKQKTIDPRERTIEYSGDNGENINLYLENKKYSVYRFKRNIINNQKYNFFTFLPLFLYEQFNQFWNFYFLFVAITQLPIKGSVFEPFWIGFWWTTVLPLCFVVSISMLRELFDDLQRKKRDYSLNHEKYQKLNIRDSSNTNLITNISCCKIKIGDLIILNEGDRVPCDCILLYTSNENGTSYIKTDQLDGETDWKLRKSIPSIQGKNDSLEDFELNGRLTVESPHLDIYKFVGKYEHQSDDDMELKVDALNLENTLWGSTIIASEGVCVACAVYLGSESRSQLNANKKQSKFGKIDKELNRLSKYLVGMLVFISFIMTLFNPLAGIFRNGIHIKTSYLYFGRFILILSDIIPLSLRVYMDLSKIWFSYVIQSDNRHIPGTQVRDTTIPEELGRIQYLFSDKTGTLTKNEMIFQKLQLKPPLLFQSHNHKLIHYHCLEQYVNSPTKKKKIKRRRKKEKQRTSSLLGIDELHDKLQSEVVSKRKSSLNDNKSIRSSLNGAANNKSVSLQVSEAIEALALCHNVTPIMNENGSMTYEASSPDEIAMVKFTEKCGVKLMKRSSDRITLRIYENVSTEDALFISDDDDDDIKIDDDVNFINLDYEILDVFPFTSAAKRMGIIIKNTKTGEITFYAKGADIVMKNMIESNEWMEEEVENLSREGLRTLVFAKKTVTNDEYKNFVTKYNAASVLMNSEQRKINMESVRASLLEQDMELLAVTGVEDKLQNNVQSTIEILRNAHIKIWMLTGDKIETAKVIARSSRLISYGQEMYQLIVKNKRDAYHKLDILYGKNNTKSDIAVIIDGKSLDIFMNSGDENLNQQFLEYMISCDVVIACRCSPTQKAEMVQSVQQMTQKICCAIGDGGNDVSMILKANVGVGIVGKEGQQASLSSDFSIHRFEYLSVLLLWHGRLAYKNTSVISQFVIHRGLIIAFTTCVFSVIFYFTAIPLFTGALMVGYTCIYTSAPVFALVLDKDVSFENSLFYPELYHSLQNGLSLNNKTFLLWIMRSFYQGSIVMLMTLILFEDEMHNIVSIAFTALILTELYNVYLEIHKIHSLMIITEFISILLYIISVLIFSQTYFDKDFVFSSTFLFKSLMISLVANVPVFIVKYIHKKCNPSMQAKLKDEAQ